MGLQKLRYVYHEEGPKDSDTNEIPEADKTTLIKLMRASFLFFEKNRCSVDDYLVFLNWVSILASHKKTSCMGTA